MKKIKTYRLTIKFYEGTDEVIYISEVLTETTNTVYEIGTFDMTDYFDREYLDMIDGVTVGEA